jgi:hypothetical protein
MALCLSTATQAKYSGGTGEPNDPYLIATAEDMNSIGANPDDWDKHFLLVNDINLADYTGTQFNIIGNENIPFTGVFDGNGNTISNFTYECNDIGSIGIFCYINNPNAEIKNLTLIDPNINAAGFSNGVGSLIGSLGNGMITDCCVEGGSVSGDDYVGGLVGYNSGAISNCNATNNVSGTYAIGGLVGVNYGTISSCYSVGNVSGGDWETGGLVGDNEGTISDCYAIGTVSGGNIIGGMVGDNSGKISNCYAAGTIDGNDYTGGLVGWSSSGTILNCYSTGAVSGHDSVGGMVGSNENGKIWNCYAIGSVFGNWNVGGLVGCGNGVILNCYATGSVLGTTNTGGLVGDNCDGVISNCYATGSVSGINSTGGLVGYNEDGLVSASFWDIETSDCNTSSGGTGKTTFQMQDINTFLDAGWDFINETANGTCNFWMMPINGGYPILSIFQGYVPPEPVGSGTEEDPYIIANANTLGTIWYRPSAHYVLANDINLAGIQWSMAVAPEFKGVLDGNGFCFQNLSINGGGWRLGLLGWSGGEVKNLGLETCMVSGEYEVGGMVGENSGAISNCYVTGVVSGKMDVGGLVGGRWGGTISKCYAMCSVSGGNCAGGLIGNNWYGTISDCYATGGVVGDNYVGGLVGENYRGVISNCSATGGIDGNERIGGLVGYSKYGTISNCYSTGSVSGKTNVGGLVGDNDHGLVSDCYATGSILGINCTGGLVGGNFDYGTILKCYATGEVSGNNYIGGLVGYNYYGAVTASFWDVNTSGQSSSAGGTGKTTAEMKTRNTFTNAGWDFVNIWDICEGTNYPKLVWQILIADFACPDGVNLVDFAVLASAWLSDANDPSWNPIYDISQPSDNVIDERDLMVFCDHWLE